MNPDPIGFDGNFMNYFPYASNNPVTHKDVYGLDPLDPSLPETPSPGQKTCIEKMTEKYEPQLKFHMQEYLRCYKNCDVINNFKCMDQLHKSLAIRQCQIGCFILYKLDSYPIQIKWALRANICRMLYRGSADYHNTE